VAAPHKHFRVLQNLLRLILIPAHNQDGLVREHDGAMQRFNRARPRYTDAPPLQKHNNSRAATQKLFLILVQTLTPNLQELPVKLHRITLQALQALFMNHLKVYM